jgi:uncharacterized protein (TIGR02147 family)
MFIKSTPYCLAEFNKVGPMESIFTYRNYKSFLNDKIEGLPNQGHGVKTALSNAVGCQRSYLTHVLRGDAHLNSDQAVLTARYFGLNEVEGDYLMHMVLSERAASKDLKAHYEARLNSLLNDHYLLKNRVKIKGTVGDSFKAVFYSSWHYQAVQILLTIPGFRSKDKIKARLNLSDEKVNGVLQVLVQAGLARKSGVDFLPTEKQVFLQAADTHIAWHHKNWRGKAMEYIDRGGTQNFHASFVVSLSARDFIRLRERMKTALAEVLHEVKASEEEELACVNMDFFLI